MTDGNRRFDSTALAERRHGLGQLAVMRRMLVPVSHAKHDGFHVRLAKEGDADGNVVAGS